MKGGFGFIAALSLAVLAIMAVDEGFEADDSTREQQRLLWRQAVALERIAESLEGGCEDAGAGSLPEGVGFGPSLEAYGWSPWGDDGTSTAPFGTVIELPVELTHETVPPFGTIITIPPEAELLQQFAGEGIFVGPAQ